MRGLEGAGTPSWGVHKKLRLWVFLFIDSLGDETHLYGMMTEGDTPSDEADE